MAVPAIPGYWGNYSRMCRRRLTNMVLVIGVIWSFDIRTSSASPVVGEEWYKGRDSNHPLILRRSLQDLEVADPHEQCFETTCNRVTHYCDEVIRSCASCEDDCHQGRISRDDETIKDCLKKCEWYYYINSLKDKLCSAPEATESNAGLSDPAGAELTDYQLFVIILAVVTVCFTAIIIMLVVVICCIRKKSLAKPSGNPHQSTLVASQTEKEHIQTKESRDSEIMWETRPDDQENTEDEQKLIPQPVIPEPAFPEVRRSARPNKGQRPEGLIEIANTATEIMEPKTFKEACQSQESVQWKEAMDSEVQSLIKNETWQLTELPDGKSAIGCKWVYQAKTDEKGNITRYEARLVAQGFSQKFGKQYDEVLAPVAKQATFRMLLTIAGHKKMKVKHYDIETAYLKELSHEVYMKQPEGYHQGADNLVCKLNKSLYGLKQEANEWNKKLHQTLIKNNFEQSESDHCLYSRQHEGEWMYIYIHVDDLIAASTDNTMFQTFEREVNKEFIMKDLGNISCYLGLQIEQDSDGIYLLHQKNYIERKLQEFNLTKSKLSNIPIDTGYQKRQEPSEIMKNQEVYRSAIDSLLYLATNSRPDIAIGTSILARNVKNARQADWTEVKRIFRYLNKTKDKKLKLGSLLEQNNNQLIGYADADWASDTSDRKSNTGFLFKYLGSPIMWCSRKQSLVALSSTEAEYIALSEAVKEGLWIRRILKDFNQGIVDQMLIFEDNQSCIKQIQDEKLFNRTKHIDTKYHFIRELHKTGDIEIKYCPTSEMPADLLTKPLDSIKLKHLSEIFGII